MTGRPTEAQLKSKATSAIQSQFAKDFPNGKLESINFKTGFDHNSLINFFNHVHFDATYSGIAGRKTISGTHSVGGGHVMFHRD